MVILCEHGNIILSRHEGMRLASYVQASDGQLQSASFLMLKPLQTPDSAWETRISQQLAKQLMTAKWGELNSFVLAAAKQHALSTAILSQLAKGTWPSLLHLDILQCELSAQDCLLLSQGNWQKLRQLDSIGTSLNAECMALLAKGKWPFLQSISLFHTANLDAVAIANLSTANWPSLHSPDLCKVLLNAAMVAELAKLHLPNLTSIDLSKTGLTPVAMSALARADWPSLSYLNVGFNDLNAAAVRHLCTICLPALRALDTMHANIAQGSWPLLSKLRLTWNRLDTKAVKHITSGVIWPNLHSLSLSGNCHGHGGLQHLIERNWRQLRRLSVDIDVLQQHDSLALLGIAANEVQKLNASRSHVTLHRSFSQADQCLWPNLDKVIVYKRQ